MTQHYMNKAAFPIPPVDPRISHYFDASDGQCYYWDGDAEAYALWNLGATPSYPQVFSGPK